MNPFQHGVAVTGPDFCPRPELISALIGKCYRSGGAVTAARPASDTMVFNVPDDDRIAGYLVRDRVFHIETPQVFPAEVIHQAFQRRGSRNLTDETSLLYALEFPVRLHLHRERNPKITTRDDLAHARAYAEVLANRPRD